MTASLVVFDCDGVLVDTEVIMQRVDLDMVPRLGWPITLEEVHEHFLGRKSVQVVAAIEDRLGTPVPDGWADERRSAYRAACASDLRAVPGVIEAVAAIHERGVLTCVASSGSHQAIRHSLGLTGLWPTFEGRVFSAHDVARPKPAPDVFLHAAATLGMEPSSCVVVEDSPVGVRAAKAAGMRVIGYAGRTPEVLLDGADEVIREMAALLGALGADSADG